jgi:hypothetical protein
MDYLTLLACGGGYHGWRGGSTNATTGEEGSMREGGGELESRHFDRSWDRWIPAESRADLANLWRRRFSADMHRVLQNELLTRTFLSDVVYGVPEEWLDEVVRVRMGELDEE